MTTPGASTPSFSDKTDLNTENNPYSIALDDLNGDEKPDLVVTNLNSNTVSVFLNTTPGGAPTPSFSAQPDLITGSNPHSIAIGDFNGDGKPDIAVANQNSNTVSVFLNTSTMIPPSYALNVNAINGTVAVNPASGPYNFGTSVTLTPTAFMGYAFVNWTGNIPAGHETDNPLTVIMDANKTITANFVIQQSTNVQMTAGWNLASVPRIQTNDSASVIFPGKIGSVFEYNTATRDYTSAATLSNGPGYWFNYQTTGNITITGSAPGTLTVAVSQTGWVLVGSRNVQVQTSTLILSNGATIVGSIYRYNAITKMYSTTTVINPGDAVWINISKACTITIP
jgi:hypothetical protein